MDEHNNTGTSDLDNKDAMADTIKKTLSVIIYILLVAVVVARFI